MSNNFYNHSERLNLRLLSIVVYAYLFAAASSVHADLRFLDDATDSDSNLHDTEVVESQLDLTSVKNTFQDNVLHYHTFPAHLDGSFSLKEVKRCQSALKAHFDHCFDFVTMNAALIISYLHYQSELSHSLNS